MSLLTTVQESMVGDYYFNLKGTGLTGPTGPTGAGYVIPPLVVNNSVNPTIALTSATLPETVYVLTGSGTANFTTVGLTTGFLIYVRNGTTADINIQANGVAIAGLQSVLHGQNTSAGTTGRNSTPSMLYWNGTILTMY